MFAERAGKIRLYAAGILNYESILETVPKKTKVELLKAGDCKKLNGQDCSPACPGGYIYQKEMIRNCRVWDVIDKQQRIFYWRQN